ncbi:DUF899 family protein [Micromonospora sp. NPDC005806]|uniref:DUF899 family protein n=1 Tax=Micromonospora sp. NPDC005806 TaxID=3364234 RepID=UPI003676F441
MANAGVSWCTFKPLAQIEEYKASKGWSMPFVSSHGTSFSNDCGASGGFMLSAFLRDGDDVYRTYSTTAAWTSCSSSTASWISPSMAAGRIGRTPRPTGRSSRPTAGPLRT